MTRVFVLLLLLGLAGCGSSSVTPNLSEVKGNVTLAGKPVNRVTITFTPADGQGDTDVGLVENGEYKTQLIAKKYKVSFAPAAGGTQVPFHYRKPQTSGFELNAATEHERNWELKAEE